MRECDTAKARLVIGVHDSPWDATVASLRIVLMSVGWISIHAHQFAWTKVHPTGLALVAGMLEPRLKRPSNTSIDSLARLDGFGLDSGVCLQPSPALKVPVD